ncbi:MAG TPA: FAD-dependent oxidoreductase [Acidimicrobiales bacterium]|nr:FAD-dependent oxidoreductase [Acidimicrobiales bacterium]
MGSAVVVLVDDDPQGSATTEGELRKRYGADYDVVSYRSPAEALRALPGLGRPVAVVLAALGMDEMSGVEFLARAGDLHPTAKRALLAGWNDEGARDRILDAFALGQIDCHLARPRAAPDEAFHQVVAELLAEWAKAHAARPAMVRIVGDPSSPRCHQMRDLLERHGIPFHFLASDAEAGQALLTQVGAEASAGPVVVLHDGRVLTDPSNEEAADALGGRADLGDHTFDQVVVGAGPAGLGAAVYAASEGLRTLVVEREAIGGQAGTTSRIRNYLGFPRGVAGSDLASRAYAQALHFGALFHIMREVVELRPGSPFHELTLSDGEVVRARSVVVATGVTYRRLDVESLERLVGRGVFYSPAVSEAPAMAGRPVVVVGGGNSAGQAAVHLARYASQVTVLVRGDALAASMSDYLVKEIAATRNITVRFRTVARSGTGEHHLEGLVLHDTATGASEHVEARGLFVLIGGEPRTDWLPAHIERGQGRYVATGPDVSAGGDRLALETSVPGIFAAGDVRHRSVKRVASAAGEGAMVVAMVHEHLSRPSPESASPGGRP